MNRLAKSSVLPSFTVQKGRLLALFGSVLLVASCSSGPMEYESIDDIASAMADAGFTCRPDELEVPDGTLGNFACEWPSDQAATYPDDFLQVYLFESDLARVQYLFGLFVWCGAGPEPLFTVSYAYGPTWAVFSGSCQGSPEDWADIAETMGGRANEFDLMSYETFDFERPFEDWTLNELKEFLGEPVTAQSDGAAVTGEAPPSTLLAVDPVLDTDAPEVGAAALEAGWEVLGWPEMYEATDVIATNNGYLVVGSTGFRAAAWMSQDGINWDPLHYSQDALDTGRIIAIASSNNGLVAVGENADFEATSWLSAEGNAWERFDGAFGQFAVSDVSAGPRGFVVVGQSTDGRIDVLTSPDGRRWDSQRLRLDARLGVAGKLAAANGGTGSLVLIGTDPYPFFSDEFAGEEVDAHRGLVWFSPDGVAWEQVAGDPVDEVDPMAIAWGPAGFLLIGQRGDAVISLTSSDGLSWSAGGTLDSEADPAQAPPNLLVRAVVWSGSEWIAGGSRLGETWVAYRSEDGVSWTEISLPSITGGIRSLASGAQGLVAVGDTEGQAERDSGDQPVSLIAHSIDGTTWSIVAGEPDGALPEIGGFRDVAAAGETLYALGDGGIWTSLDGRAWQSIGMPAALAEESLDQLHRWNDTFYVIARGEVWSSPDAIDWSMTLDPRATNDAGLVVQLFATEWGLYAVGLVGDEGAIWVLDDGPDWRRVPEDPHFFPVRVVAIAGNSNGELVAIGEYGALVWTSTDGSNWTRWEQPQPLFGDFPNSPALIATASGWVMVGASEDEIDLRAEPAAWTSSDGRTWTPAEVESSAETGWMESVIATPDGFVAGGSEGLWHSEDGREWEMLVVAPVEASWEVDLLVRDDQVIAVGGFGFPIVWLGPATSP